MTDPHPWYRWDGDLLVLSLHVQPRARCDEIAGVHGDRLKVRITAPPADGKANAHLIAFIAELFQVPKSQVELIAGASGRDKRVGIRSPRHLPPFVGPPPRV